MEDIDLEKVKAYLELRSANSRQTSRFENIERVLVGMGCAVTTDDGIHPTNAGLCYMERLGSGIRFMLDETERTGLPAPQFREMGEFIVTFHKAPELLPPQPQIQPQAQPQYAGTLWEEKKHPQPELRSLSQPDQRERRLSEALDYVHTHGFITNSMYRQLTGVSDRTAHRDLEMLVERGRLKGTGQRSARRYVLA
jgi:predicted HTH transcriptional regulator